LKELRSHASSYFRWSNDFECRFFVFSVIPLPDLFSALQNGKFLIGTSSNHLLHPAGFSVLAPVPLFLFLMVFPSSSWRMVPTFFDGERRTFFPFFLYKDFAGLIIFLSSQIVDEVFTAYLTMLIPIVIAT